jgi:hypothetical protein
MRSTWPFVHLCRRHPGFLFLDHPPLGRFVSQIACRAMDNLRLGETALSHSFAPSKVEQTLHYNAGDFGGRATLYAELSSST